MMKEKTLNDIMLEIHNYGNANISIENLEHSIEESLDQLENSIIKECAKKWSKSSGRPYKYCLDVLNLKDK